VRCDGFEECSMSVRGLPTCGCPPCTDDALTTGPVCSSFQQTYASLCALVTKGCKDRSDEFLLAFGACVQDCEVGAWGEYGECSTPCGAGVSSRVREVLVAPDSGGEKCPNLLDTMPCFQPPCADSMCDDTLCERPGAMCLLGEDGKPGCECPKACMSQDEAPVCGLLMGRKPNTFFNLCKLRRVACLYALPFTVLHKGACGGASGEDSRCSPLPQFSLVTRGDCQTRYHVATAECSGSCGEDMNLCCQPSGTTTVQAKLTCADGPAQFVDVETITSCECMELPVAMEAP